MDIKKNMFKFKLIFTRDFIFFERFQAASHWPLFLNLVLHRSTLSPLHIGLTF